MELEISLQSIRKEAWSQIAGFKKTAWSALGVYAAIGFACMLFLLLMRFVALHVSGFAFLLPITYLLTWCVLIPLNAGVLLVGYQRYIEAPTKQGQVFACFQQRVFVPLLLAGVINQVLSMVIFSAARSTFDHILLPGSMSMHAAYALMLLVLVVFICFLYFAAAFTSLLVVLQARRPIEAILMAFNGVLGHCWTILGLGLLFLVLYLVSACTLFIAAIWFAPFILLMTVGAYWRLFLVRFPGT